MCVKWCHLPSTFCIRKIDTHLKEKSTLSEKLIASRDATGFCRVLFAIAGLFQSLSDSMQKEECYVPIKISGTFNYRLRNKGFRTFCDGAPHIPYTFHYKYRS